MMRQKLSALQVQRPILAPMMQKSITILLLPSIELATAIEQELQANPLLEVDDISQMQKQQQENEEFQRKINSLSQLSSDLPYLPGMVLEDDEEHQCPIVKEITLEDRLLRQLRLEISDPLKLKIGEQIIGNINEDGYLTVDCKEIAASGGAADVSLVEEILKIIQYFDPVGIAARDLKECLLVQLESCGAVDPKTKEIIEMHLSDLGNKKYKELARALKLSIDEVKRIAELISSLEPKPARNFRPINPNIYIKPDLFIRKEETGLRVQINSEDIPTLKINPIYKSMLNKKDLSLDERTFIEERLQSAMYFIKSIKQREETLMRIANFILERQGQFFIHGPTAIVPLTLKDVADIIERDESTVSRAIRHKYIDTPQGVYPLKFFFSGGIASQFNGFVATRSIKEEIRSMIEDENKLTPLSYQDIQNQLEKRGISVARRTISKYRQGLRISPSHLRKN